MTLSESEITTNNGNFLKKYKILGKIGEGSFSNVLKCQERETGKLYAAKRLKHTKETIQEVLLTPEVIALRKLMKHQNILQMNESFFDPLPGKVTLVFELMDMSLYDLIKDRKRPLPELKMKNYLYQILKGVNHLNKHGLFHRDIKPENILIKCNEEEDIIKLADLGSVRGIFCRPPLTEYISTRWYRSPECLLTKGFYGPKMDVWAIGCVYYEILTLKPLFPGANETDQLERIHSVLGTPSRRIIEKFFKHKSRNYEVNFPHRVGIGLSSLMRGFTDEGIDIVKRMLIYDPTTRSNVRRLIEHRYFEKLRNDEKYIKRMGEIKESILRNVKTNMKNTIKSSIHLPSHHAVDQHYTEIKNRENGYMETNVNKNGNKLSTNNNNINNNNNNMNNNLPKRNPIFNNDPIHPLSTLKSRKTYPNLSNGNLKNNLMNKVDSCKLNNRSTGFINYIQQPLQKPLSNTKCRPMDSELTIPKRNPKSNMSINVNKLEGKTRLPSLIKATNLKSKPLQQQPNHNKQQHPHQQQYLNLPRVKPNYFY